VNIGKGTIKGFGSHGINAGNGSELTIIGFNISEAAAAAAYFGILLTGVQNFNIGPGIVRLDDTYDSYGVFLSGSTGHGRIAGVNISDCLSAIYDSSTGDYVIKTDNDVSDNNTYKISDLGTRANSRTFNNLGVAVPSHADNAAAVTAGMSVGEFYQLGATDHLGVVHA
jgi:hypothetical protein